MIYDCNLQIWVFRINSNIYQSHTCCDMLNLFSQTVCTAVAPGHSINRKIIRHNKHNKKDSSEIKHHGWRIMVQHAPGPVELPPQWGVSTAGPEPTQTAPEYPGPLHPGHTLLSSVATWHPVRPPPRPKAKSTTLQNTVQP